MQHRRIATEEAFAIPEQFDAWRELLKKSTDYDPDLFLARAQTDGGLLSRRLLDVDQERLRIMDEAHVDVHLLALTSTGVQALETELAVSIAALGNDRLAAAIARHPTRYAGLATIAPQDPKRAVKEMERAISTLKLSGVMINSHTNGEYLDELKFWPILEAAAGLDVPIYIHPRSPSPGDGAAVSQVPPRTCNLGVCSRDGAARGAPHHERRLRQVPDPQDRHRSHG